MALLATLLLTGWCLAAPAAPAGPAGLGAPGGQGARKSERAGAQLGGPRWETDLDEAFALAARSERPLMIVFR